MHDVDRPVLPSRDILDKAHHEAIGFWRIDHDRRDFDLAEHSESFKPAFATYKVVAYGAGTWPTANRYRALQADRLDIVDNFAVRPLVPGTRIKNIDPGNWDHLDLLIT
jgi:hypothetical protein